MNVICWTGNLSTQQFHVLKSQGQHRQEKEKLERSMHPFVWSLLLWHTSLSVVMNSTGCFIELSYQVQNIPWYSLFSFHLIGELYKTTYEIHFNRKWGMLYASAMPFACQGMLMGRQSCVTSRYAQLRVPVYRHFPPGPDCLDGWMNVALNWASSHLTEVHTALTAEIHVSQPLSDFTFCFSYSNWLEV